MDGVCYSFCYVYCVTVFYPIEHFCADKYLYLYSQFHPADALRNSHSEHNPLPWSLT